MTTYRTWSADAGAPITADSGFFTADGGIPFVVGQMPYIVGLELPVAQVLLQQAGILNLNTLGYFTKWPITVIWLSNTGQVPNIVITQKPNLGASLPANSPITLGVAEFPMSVAYP